MLCGKSKLVKDIDSQIVRFIHGNKLKAYVAVKKGWTQTEMETVDWEAMVLVCKSDTSNDILWKMKPACGFVPVATRMVMTKQWESDQCPRCMTHIETLEHLLACPSAGAKQLRERHIDRIQLTLRERNTDPCIISTIVDALNSTASGRFQDHVPPEASELIHQAAREQDALGRISIFQGYISKTWSAAQTEYWYVVPTRKRRSIRQWSCQFLRLWFHFLKEQWQH